MATTRPVRKNPARKSRAPAASLPQRLKTYDDTRDSFPGEHWLVLAAGIAVWGLTRKHPSGFVRGAGIFASSALVGRAASGRDGLSKLLRWLPFGGRVR